jgi:hypothetical protein
MKKLISAIMVLGFLLIFVPTNSYAAGGIFASGGGTKTVGQSFTVSVVASGATFNYVQGQISVSGPVSISSFSAGSADVWMSKPANNGAFAGAFLGRTLTSFTVATITLKGTSAGNGAVSVSGAVLENAGGTVATGAGGASFTIQNPPDLPGAPAVNSPTHPDPTQSYDATTITLNWNKVSGVDGFSYLLDQAASTTPASKITDANTTVTYTNQAIGTYYFHIKAHKADGWGPVTNFTINIKKPDPKINDQLSKPLNINIEKSSSYSENLADGTVTGIIISGKTEANYTANSVLSPVPTIPTGKALSVASDGSGNFQIIIDYPIKSGFYTLTVQGQQDLVLTPLSDQTMFEISLAKGGTINILTAADAQIPKVATTPVVKESFFKKVFPVSDYLIVLLILAIVALGSIELNKFLKRRKKR